MCIICDTEFPYCGCSQEAIDLVTCGKNKKQKVVYDSHGPVTRKQLKIHHPEYTEEYLDEIFGQQDE